MADFPARIWDGSITAPGVYLGVPETRYHEDPCPEPSLSSHVARIALKRSARHAQVAHPRFIDPEIEAELAEAEDEDEAPKAPARHLLIGQAAHTFTLGAGAPVVDCKVRKFTTKDGKARRDLVLDNGGIPLRTQDYNVARRMALIARPFLRDLLGGEFVPEAMLAWQERGIWRRGLIDAARPDFRKIADYKTIGIECPPSALGRIMASRDLAFQDRFYVRGLDRLDPEGQGRRRFFFVFQEVEYPHAIAVGENSEAARTLADERVEGACNIWDRAISTREWPAYDTHPVQASPKPWDLQEWEERAMSDEALNPMELEPA